MIKIENTVTPSPAQWEAIIRGMRNPMNSWARSDSYTTHIEDPQTHETADYAFIIGDVDKELMRKLAKGGPVHAKYRRMIPVYVDITAPLYWWKEFDTYKVGTVCNSCSTMHKIHEKEFTLDDFSCEHLLTDEDLSIGDIVPTRNLEATIFALNEYRRKFLDTVTYGRANGKTKYLADMAKQYWHQMIQLLPSSYNQTRTIMLSYEVLTNIYRWRKDHKLDEWRELCKWIEELPHSDIITGGVEA